VDAVGHRADDETGYGRYEWTVASDVRDLDPQAVVGMFTWSDDDAFHNRELAADPPQGTGRLEVRIAHFRFTPAGQGPGGVRR